MHCLLLCQVPCTAAAKELRDINFSIWRKGDEKPVSVAEMILFWNASSQIPGVLVLALCSIPGSCCLLESRSSWLCVH